MQLVRGLHNLKPRHHGSVATIGNFDGVHLGHQSVFRHLLEKGAELDLPTTVVTFEPQPREFFQPDSAPARLTRLREKLQAIEETGVQRVVVLEFNKRLAAVPAEDFVKELLVDGLGVRFLSVGDDFRFGRGREGGDIHKWADHPVGDSLCRWNAENSCCVTGKGDLPCLLKDVIERRQGFWGMNFILIPELGLFPFTPVH